MAATTSKLGTAELLYRCAKRMGMQPVWVVPDGLFAVSIDGREEYINFARSSLNSHASASLARDKYLTRLVLGRHNMRNIPFTRARTQAAAVAFLGKYGKIIAKPVSGSGARDIHIVTSVTQLSTLNLGGYILEKYIAGQEMRYLVLNGSVIGVHRSDYGTSVEETRPLERISYPEATWDEALIASSIQVARVLGLKFAAVDYMVDQDGQAYILEVNTTPGLKWFHAPTSGPEIDVARLFLEASLDASKAVTTPVKSVAARLAPSRGV